MKAILGFRPAMHSCRSTAAPGWWSGHRVARLSVFCSEDGTLTAPPDACAVGFHFHDMRGRIVKQSAATLPPGTTGFLDIRSPEAGVATGGRVGIMPCLRIESGRAFGLGGRSVATHSPGENQLPPAPLQALMAREIQSPSRPSAAYLAQSMRMRWPIRSHAAR